MKNNLITTMIVEERKVRILRVGNINYISLTDLAMYQNSSDPSFTIKKWLTPNGTWINDNKGISPDIESALSTDYYNDPTDENDSQLQRALKYIEQKQ